MARRNTRSGGVFLTIAILGGFAVGVAMGEPTLGAILGTAVGIVAALVVWLIDRR